MGSPSLSDSKKFDFLLGASVASSVKANAKMTYERIVDEGYVVQCRNLLGRLNSSVETSFGQ